MGLIPCQSDSLILVLSPANALTAGLTKRFDTGVKKRPANSPRVARKAGPKIMKKPPSWACSACAEDVPQNGRNATNPATTTLKTFATTAATVRITNHVGA